MSRNFAKTLVWKLDYDVILWRHKQRTPNTNDYPMPLNETPHEKFLRTPLNLLFTSLFTSSYGKHLFYRKHICSARNISCRNICQHSFNQRWSRSRSEFPSEPEWTPVGAGVNSHWSRSELPSEPEWTPVGAGVNSRRRQRFLTDPEHDPESEFCIKTGPGVGVKFSVFQGWIVVFTKI